jgi:hypothetical protein
MTFKKDLNLKNKPWPSKVILTFKSDLDLQKRPSSNTAMAYSSTLNQHKNGMDSACQLVKHLSHVKRNQSIGAKVLMFSVTSTLSKYSGDIGSAHYIINVNICVKLMKTVMGCRIDRVCLFVSFYTFFQQYFSHIGG